MVNKHSSEHENVDNMITLPTRLSNKRDNLNFNMVSFKPLLE